MNKERLNDKCRGSLIGGAVGDALGYPVEFINSFNEICDNYGKEGITEYDISYSDTYGETDSALISDDTQMTLYTAEGLLEAQKSGLPIVTNVREAYLAWFAHQAGRKVNIEYDSELSKIVELNKRRAPGNTCMSALMSLSIGRKPYNNSKGCGGIMRVSPIGIYGAVHGWKPDTTAKIAGDIAELTHLHTLSTYASAALAVIVQLCITEDSVDVDRFIEIINEAIGVLKSVYGDSVPAIYLLDSIICKALELADRPLHDWEIIEDKIGGGWVAEETLAIALFCVLRHINDFNACLKSAVNHGGDSDSTGAVAGNIIGAILGYSKIPEKFLTNLQFHDLILEMANRLII